MPARKNALTHGIYVAGYYVSIPVFPDTGIIVFLSVNHDSELAMDLRTITQIGTRIMILCSDCDCGQTADPEGTVNKDNILGTLPSLINPAQIGGHLLSELSSWISYLYAQNKFKIHVIGVQKRKRLIKPYWTIQSRLLRHL